MEFQEAKELLEDYLHNISQEDLTPHDIAQYLKIIKHDDEDLYTKYLRRLDPEILGDVAIELPDSLLKDVIQTISSEKIVEAIKELESDDATDLFQHIENIDEYKAKELFDGLDKEDQDEILKLRSYDEEEAGAYMQTELFSAQLKERLGDAVARLRELKKNGELENISQLFVVDESKILKHVIPLEELILFDFSNSILNIINQKDEEYYKPHTAKDSDNIEDVIGIVQDYDLSVVPVVDEYGVLMGRITSDDIHDIIEEKATEQIYNLAGVDDEAEEEDTLIKAGKARGLWLFINLFTAIISSSIVGLFDETIANYVALAVLMPIVASMGGNTGTQALAVTVRRLSIGNIEFKDAKHVLKREVGISLVNGIIFGALMGVIAWVWFDKPLLGVEITCSMMINLSLAGFFGAIIPLSLKKLNIDPAVGSAVLLTTCTDCIGFFSFLGLAKWMLV